MLDVTPESIDGMKVTELKEALTTMGLSTKGVKKELAARLLEAISSGAAGAAGAAAAPSGDADAPADEPTPAEEPPPAPEPEPAAPAVEEAPPAPAPVVDEPAALCNQLDELLIVVADLLRHRCPVLVALRLLGTDKRRTR